MNDLRKAAEMALEALGNNRRDHYYCEDRWYSCPKHEDGCANDSEGNECNCGADKANQEIDSAIAALRQALAQPEQAPVGMTCKVWTHGCALFDGIDLPNETLLYTAPPSKPWVSLTNEQISSLKNLQGANRERTATEMAFAVDAKLKELNHG